MEGVLLSSAELDGAGVAGRDCGTGVDVAVGRVEPFCFLDFFLADSVPLASDRLGDPGRFRFAAAFFSGSECLFLPDGVLVPFVDAPDCSLLLSFSFCWGLSDLFSAFFRSSSFRFSSSVSSEELY